VGWQLLNHFSFSFCERNHVGFIVYARYGKSATELPNLTDDVDALVYYAALKKFSRDCAEHGVDLHKYPTGATILADYEPVYKLAKKSILGKDRTDFTTKLPKVKWLHIPKW
jgi:hypothetical protein